MTVRSSDLRAAVILARDARPTIRRLAFVRRPADHKERSRALLLSIGEMDGRRPTLIVETTGHRYCRIDIRTDEELEALEHAIRAVRAAARAKETP